MYSQVRKKLFEVCAANSRDFYSYEWPAMERTCQKKQLFGNLLGLCLYCQMDPRNDLAFGSYSTWWPMPVLVQLALPGADQRTPRVSSSCPTTLGSSLHDFLKKHLPAPGMAELHTRMHTSNLYLALAVMCHLLPCLLLLLLCLLPLHFLFVLLLFSGSASFRE